MKRNPPSFLCVLLRSSCGLSSPTAAIFALTPSSLSYRRSLLLGSLALSWSECFSYLSQPVRF